MESFIESSMVNLEGVGVVKKEGCDKYGNSRFRLLTVNGFEVEYRAPKSATPIRTHKGFKLHIKAMERKNFAKVEKIKK